MCDEFRPMPGLLIQTLGFKQVFGVRVGTGVTRRSMLSGGPFDFAVTRSARSPFPSNIQAVTPELRMKKRYMPGQHSVKSLNPKGYVQGLCWSRAATRLRVQIVLTITPPRQSEFRGRR